MMKRRRTWMRRREMTPFNQRQRGPGLNQMKAKRRRRKKAKGRSNITQAVMNNLRKIVQVKILMMNKVYSEGFSKSVHLTRPS
jgi:hypothetical protein